MTIKLLKDVKDYTHSDLRVAEFIEESGEEVLFMNIGQVAERLNLSEATVSRSVRHLGFSKISREGKLILDYRNDVGYKVLSFTGRNHIPSDEQGDVNLYVYRGESGEYHSMVAATAVVDILVLALAEKMKTSATQQLKKIEKLKQRYGEIIFS